MRWKIELLLAVGVMLATACQEDECADFVGDCIGVGISVATVDQNREPFPVSSISYSSTAGVTGEACSSAEGCTWVWIPVEVRDDTFTIVAVSGAEQVTDKVEIDAAEVTDVGCCGQTLREETTLTFDGT